MTVYYVGEAIFETKISKKDEKAIRKLAKAKNISWEEATRILIFEDDEFANRIGDNGKLHSFDFEDIDDVEEWEW